MLKIGHRGACGHAPENTLLSIRKALDFGVDGFEFDIQMSRDGHPVVIHDPTLERTTNATGKVADYTLAELQTFNAGQGEKIPSLADVFKLVDGRCRLFIELKAHDCNAAVAKLIGHYIGKNWRYDQIFVCAFDHFQLLGIKRLDPHINTCALMAAIPINLAESASQAGAMAFNPCIHHMNRALVDDAHWRGLKVFAWTCNALSDIELARSYGVDGVISDYPDRL